MSQSAMHLERCHRSKFLQWPVSLNRVLGSQSRRSKEAEAADGEGDIREEKTKKREINSLV